MTQRPNPGGRNKGCKKSGGRKKGTPNKISSEARQYLGLLFTKGMKSFSTYLNELNGKEKLQFYMQVAGFIISKPANLDFVAEEERNNPEVDEFTFIP